VPLARVLSPWGDVVGRWILDYRRIAEPCCLPLSLVLIDYTSKRRCVLSRERKRVRPLAALSLHLYTCDVFYIFYLDLARSCTVQCTCTIFNSVHGTPGGTPTGRFCRFEPLHQSQEWLTVPFWNRLSVDHMTDAFWINRIQFSSQTGGGTLTLRGGYHRFRVRESGHRTFRLATQILHAYRMVHKINTDRLYEMHGTPGGTIRDPELKIHNLHGGHFRMELEFRHSEWQ